MYQDPVEKFIVEELKWHYENFGEGQSIPFVSHDPEEEKKYIRKMRKALKTVIKFYGGKV